MSAHPQPVDVDAGFCPVYECIEPGTECRPSMSAHLQSVRVMSAHLQSVRVMSAHLQSVRVDTRRQALCMNV